mmetsp:Transcript_81381/g.226664  ORF Transcript_81381/g.226664 Transcript_81381/m.226664 type:complete len:238 (+) Transcript_81381:413-1126(+)
MICRRRVQQIFPHIREVLKRAHVNLRAHESLVQGRVARVGRPFHRQPGRLRVRLRLLHGLRVEGLLPVVVEYVLRRLDFLLGHPAAVGHINQAPPVDATNFVVKHLIGQVAMVAHAHPLQLLTPRTVHNFTVHSQVVRHESVSGAHVGVGYAPEGDMLRREGIVGHLMVVHEHCFRRRCHIVHVLHEGRAVTGAALVGHTAPQNGVAQLAHLMNIRQAGVHQMNQTLLGHGRLDQAL